MQFVLAHPTLDLNLAHTADTLELQMHIYIKVITRSNMKRQRFPNYYLFHCPKKRCCEIYFDKVPESCELYRLRESQRGNLPTHLNSCEYPEKEVLLERTLDLLELYKLPLSTFMRRQRMLLHDNTVIIDAFCRSQLKQKPRFWTAYLEDPTMCDRVLKKWKNMVYAIKKIRSQLVPRAFVLREANQDHLYESKETEPRGAARRKQIGTKSKNPRKKENHEEDEKLEKTDQTEIVQSTLSTSNELKETYQETSKMLPPTKKTSSHAKAEESVKKEQAISHKKRSYHKEVSSFGFLGQLDNCFEEEESYSVFYEDDSFSCKLEPTRNTELSEEGQQDCDLRIEARIRQEEARQTRP